MAIILRYFTEFGNGPCFVLFHRFRVRCRPKTIVGGERQRKGSFGLSSIICYRGR